MVGSASMATAFWTVDILLCPLRAPRHGATISAIPCTNCESSYVAKPSQRPRVLRTTPETTPRNDCTARGLGLESPNVARTIPGRPLAPIVRTVARASRSGTSRAYHTGGVPPHRLYGLKLECRCDPKWTIASRASRTSTGYDIKEHPDLCTRPYVAPWAYYECLRHRQSRAEAYETTLHE
ncbi:hypothetical protein GY45DRAFT_898013 [Cubamyces sp. BRFM 1775]|nr:hypothetical protein GY45DRAFT_898013 [Cubamyces sp. BRFM 1775]